MTPSTLLERPVVRTRRAGRPTWLVTAGTAFSCVVAMSCTELLVWRWLGRSNDTLAVLGVTLVVAAAAAAVAALLAKLLPGWIALIAALSWPVYTYANHLDLSIRVSFIHSSVADALVTLALASAAVPLLAFRRARLALFAGALVLFVASALPVFPHRSHPPVAAGARPNDVILIVMDTTRRDHVTLYGYPRPTTPGLEKFARAAAVYDDAWSVSNWTPSSHASMFTGLLPAQHGVDGEAQPPFECDAPRLQQVLRDAGYATAGFPANPNLLARGWDAGFDDYQAPWVRGSHTWIALLNELIDARGDGWVFGHSTQRVLSMARSWWSDHADRPRFLFVNLIDPHYPYQPPPAFYARFLPATPIAEAEAVEQSPVHYFRHPGVAPQELARLTALYDGELASLDDELGRFFDWLAARGELDATLVCVTADHGERLGERGLLGHDLFPDPTLLRVPLIARMPAKIAAGRVPWRVQTDGLPGQIVRWSGLAPPGAMADHDLGEPAEAFVRAQLQEPRGFIERILIEDPNFDVSALRGDVDFVSDGRFGWTGSSDAPDAPGLLIDFDHDQDALHDVTTQQPEIAARLRKIGRNLPKFKRKRAAGSLDPIADPTDEERLRANGYISQTR